MKTACTMCFRRNDAQSAEGSQQSMTQGELGSALPHEMPSTAFDDFESSFLHCLPRQGARKYTMGELCRFVDGMGLDTSGMPGMSGKPGASLQNARHALHKMAQRSKVFGACNSVA